MHWGGSTKEYTLGWQLQSLSKPRYSVEVRLRHEYRGACGEILQQVETFQRGRWDIRFVGFFVHTLRKHSCCTAINDHSSYFSIPLWTPRGSHFACMDCHLTSKLFVMNLMSSTNPYLLEFRVFERQAVSFDHKFSVYRKNSSK